MHRRNFISLITATIGLRPLADATPVAGTTSPSPSQGQPVPALPPDPVESHPSLEAWLRLPIQPVWDRPDLHVTDHADDFYLPLEIINAARTGASLTLRYHGGTTPGEIRTLSPALLFVKIHPATTPDPATQPNYLLAWCHTRRQLRTFRVDRLAWPEPFPPVLP